MEKITYMFRPVEYSYRTKEYYEDCPKGPHWTPRTRNKFKIKVFQIVHHYSGHAPEAVSKGWKNAAKRQELRFGKQGSSRFLNKYTAHSYL